MTNPLPLKEPTDTCNGRKTDGSGYCNNTAGKGTSHPGVGRCQFHGGASPGYEKKIINELEEAGQDGALALKLRIKHLRERLEQEEEVDGKELDRLVRTALDRIGHGPGQTVEHGGRIGLDVEGMIEALQSGYEQATNQEDDDGSA